MSTDEPFEIRGFNHIALVSGDMDRTVDFYTRVLGFPLVKTLELPNGVGKHYFFDIGVGAGPQLGFFWFKEGPDAAPGIASPATFPDEKAEFATAVASMHHLAFNVPPEKLEEYRERLKANGVKCTPIINHDDSPKQFSERMHPGVHTRSIYFFDPDGFLLEFATWTRELTKEDVDDPLVEGALPTIASALSHSATSDSDRVDGGAPFT